MGGLFSKIKKEAKGHVQGTEEQTWCFAPASSGTKSKDALFRAYLGTSPSRPLCIRGPVSGASMLTGCVKGCGGGMQTLRLPHGELVADSRAAVNAFDFPEELLEDDPDGVLLPDHWLGSQSAVAAAVSDASREGGHPDCFLQRRFTPVSSTHGSKSKSRYKTYDLRVSSNADPDSDVYDGTYRFLPEVNTPGGEMCGPDNAVLADAFAGCPDLEILQPCK